MGRKTGKFEILTNFGFLNKSGHLELTQRAADVSKKSEISAKREKEKVKNNEGAFFFFIVLPALAGICPLCSLQAPQVKSLYHVTPETSANPSS